MTDLPSDDGRELLDLEQHVMDAIRTRDLKRLELLITDDFVLREPLKADVDRRAFLDAVRETPGTIEIVAGDGVRAKIEQGGEVGIITGVQRVRLRLADGTVVEDAAAFADLCVRRDGRWRMSVAFNVSLPERK
jgi:ketosteroid isomerase-like protein